MRLIFQGILLAALACATTAPVLAEVQAHPLFSSNMVLQREKPITVWGTADPSEKVTVKLGKAEATATADAKGNWKATLPAVVKPQTGLTLSIGTKELSNVAVGDVWLCSGQSNMEWRVRALTKDDQGKKVAAESKNPMLRLFSVPNRPFPTPQTTFPVGGEGKWLECTPETVIDFSAVGYFFGRDIAASQKVPVGLIASEWGGTPAEAWTSNGALKAVPSLKYYADKLDTLTKSYDESKALANYTAAMAKHKEAVAKAKQENKPAPRAPVKPGVGGVNQNTPSALYNGMIAPLLPFAIKGAIWYQGESNAGRAAEYRELFPTMIADWRKQWGYDFPFYLVQLAPFKGGQSGVDYAELRDAQFLATKKLPHVGIAIITDAGDENDIHPQRKQPVGERLALAARADAYGEKVEFSGPVYKSHTTDGNKVTITFDHVGGGLMAKGDTLSGFALAGDDQKFVPAKATIVGDTVVVTSEDVSKPMAVRFGWVNFAKPELNFFNKAGLPAAPFRTDDYPLTTATKKN